MDSFKLIVPISGAITLDVIANSLEEAIEILLEKQEILEQHAYGKLNLELDSVVVIPKNPKTFN